MSKQLADLFQGAVSTGDLSQESATALSVPDLGAKIKSGMGASLDSTNTPSEVVLLSVLIDDSSSMNEGNGVKRTGMIDGHNVFLEAITEAKCEEGIMVHARTMNKGILYKFGPVSKAVLLSNGNYKPAGGTPLFKEALVLLGTVMAETAKYKAAGIPVRSITVLTGDGGDTGGGDLAALKQLIEDMRATGDHIIMGMSIWKNDEEKNLYSNVFPQMGIPSELVLTPKADKHEIRQQFQMVSKSAIAVSKNSAAFSQVAGGFGGGASAILNATVPGGQSIQDFAASKGFSVSAPSSKIGGGF